MYSSRTRDSHLSEGFKKDIQFIDVLYIPRMTKNLISISTLEDKGYDVSFRVPKVYIQPKGSKQAKMIGIRSRKLYRLQFESPQALIGGNKDMGELWHRRMAHLHHGALIVLKEIVTGLPELSTVHSDMCKGCSLGKYAKTAFQAVTVDRTSKGILDLVHSNGCGPMSSTSLTRCEYFVTFIDDFSRKT
jgi:hypothetical protein